MANTKTRFLNWIAKRLLLRGIGTPYAHLYHADGQPYMLRFWLLRVGHQQKPDGQREARWLGARLHIIRSSDDDRAWHDHPWWFCTLLLVGRYIEHKPDPVTGADTTHEYHAGSFRFMRASAWHRLELHPDEEVITLFIHGPRRNGWGFLKQWGAKKIPWREFEGEINVRPQT